MIFASACLGMFLDFHFKNMISGKFFVKIQGIIVDFAFAGIEFWIQIGERQTARLCLKYLQSVLKKDMNFFDTEAIDSNIIFHISIDAILVQDAIGDKVIQNYQFECLD